MYLQMHELILFEILTWSKVWLWLVLFYEKEICFVNSWELIPDALTCLVIWPPFFLNGYFVCYRESLKVVFLHCEAVSYVTSDTLPMKNWEPHGCWDDRGGVREVLLVQLDSVAFLAITSTRTMAFSGIMSQECAAKWLLSVLVRLGIFISSSCPFFKMYTFVFFWNLMAFMTIFTEWVAQVPSLQWWVQGSQDLRGWFQIAYISSVEIVWQLYETQQTSS